LSVNLAKERANARLAIHVFHDYDFGRRKPGYIFPPIVAMIVAESVDGGCGFRILPVTRTRRPAEG
jgi:hypothetical protein